MILAARLLALAFLVLPRRRRFPAAVRLARTVKPLVRFLYRHHAPLDGYSGESLRLLMRAMHYNGTRFDPAMSLEGDVSEWGGTIFISAHFMLNGLFMRWLLDHGVHPVAVSTYSRRPYGIIGTSIAQDVLSVGPHLFAQIRTRVARGESVMIYVDGASAIDGSVEVSTPAGPMSLSPAPIRFAMKAGIPVCFLVTRVDPDTGRVVVAVRRPPAGSLAEIMAAFGDFLREQAGYASV